MSHWKNRLLALALAACTLLSILSPLALAQGDAALPTATLPAESDTPSEPTLAPSAEPTPAPEEEPTPVPEEPSATDSGNTPPPDASSPTPLSFLWPEGLCSPHRSPTGDPGAGGAAGYGGGGGGLFSRPG